MGLFGKTKNGATRGQKRLSTRVSGSSRVDLRLGGFSTATTILDLSEGGMRCSVAHTFPVAVGACVRAVFTIGEEELDIPAEVVRQQDSGPFLQDLGLKFLHKSPTAQARLRNHILDRQLEQQKAQR